MTQSHKRRKDTLFTEVARENKKIFFPLFPGEKFLFWSCGGRKRKIHFATKKKETGKMYVVTFIPNGEVQSFVSWLCTLFQRRFKVIQYSWPGGRPLGFITELRGIRLTKLA